MKYFITILLVLSVNTGISKEQYVDIKHIEEVNTTEQIEIKLEKFNNRAIEINHFINEKINNNNN